MQITIEIEVDRSVRRALPNYDAELDDVRTLLSDICNAAADVGSTRLRVSGFGQQAWPVDVRTDLPIVLEQLPGALRATTPGQQHQSFSLDFYEQGLQRRLHFFPDGEKYLVKCESDTDWQPAPDTELIDAGQLREMLCTLQRQFLQLAQWVIPEAPMHPWLLQWTAECGPGR